MGASTARRGVFDIGFDSSMTTSRKTFAVGWRRIPIDRLCNLAALLGWHRKEFCNLVATLKCLCVFLTDFLAGLWPT